MTEHPDDAPSSLTETSDVEREVRGRLAIYLGAGGDLRILRKTIAQFGSAGAALSSPALPARLRSEASSSGMARRVDAVLARTEEHGGRWLASGCPGFPTALVDSDVVLLCAAGKLPDEPAVTLVGSREADDYGLWCARALGGAIAMAGGVVVSGGAKGIDSASHDGTVDAGGRTVVVLGQGLASAWSSGQGPSYRRWAQHGAVLTEYLPDAHGSKQSFPERNRIVAALGVCTVVVQAATRSGTLITARLARERGRPVFAIPGEVGLTTAAGSNGLIASGEARALTSPAALAAVAGLPGLAGVGFPLRQPISTDASASADPVAALHPAVAYLRVAGPQSSATMAARFGSDWIAVALQLELEGVVRRDSEGRYLA